jgi:poly-gamma-glutamate capsule biosynthesis protein CapA/YwtB (metallophosphatase superfamily)
MNKSIQITFIGDISLNDDYSQAIENKHNPFKNIYSQLIKSDLVIGNLEAVTKGENYNFSKKTSLSIENKSLYLLKLIPIDILTLANNHIYDSEHKGFVKTIDFLEKNNIDYIGAFDKKDESRKFYRENINGINLSILNYVHPNTNPHFPKNCKIEINIYRKKEILNEIKQLKESSDYIILIFHWGLDNSHFPEPWQRKDAKEFIEAGANLIVGHHTHVLQGFEKINNSFVFYSLGNFAFSGHFNNEKFYELDNRRQRESVIMRVIKDSKRTKIKLHPIKIEGIDVVPKKDSKIHFLSFFIRFISNEAIWPFYKFYLQFFYKIYFYLFGNKRDPIVQLAKIDKKKIKRIKQILY